jgi:hypothetical protein
MLLAPLPEEFIRSTYQRTVVLSLRHWLPLSVIPFAPPSHPLGSSRITSLLVVRFICGLPLANVEDETDDMGAETKKIRATNPDSNFRRWYLIKRHHRKNKKGKV